jgi:hypothetical protein
MGIPVSVASCSTEAPALIRAWISRGRSGFSGSISLPGADLGGPAPKAPVRGSQAGGDNQLCGPRHTPDLTVTGPTRSR